MSYFDSNKNKALWEKEMSSLRQEKSRRKAEGYNPKKQAYAVASKDAVRPGRRRINLAELEQIERNANSAQAEKAAKKPRRQRSKQKEAPVLNAPKAASAS